MFSLSAGQLNQDPGEMDPLLLASRQSADDAVAKAVKVDFRQRLIDECVDSRSALFARAHADDFMRQKRKCDADILRQHGALKRQFAGSPATEVLALEFDGP